MLGVMVLCSDKLPLREGLLECVSCYGMGSHLAGDVIFRHERALQELKVLY